MLEAVAPFNSGHSLWSQISIIGVWRRIERNRQKLVGWDKGRLTEQQTKGTVTTTIQIRKYTTQNSRRNGADLTAHSRCALPSRDCLLHRSAPPSQNPE